MRAVQDWAKKILYLGADFVYEESFAFQHICRFFLQRKMQSPRCTATLLSLSAVQVCYERRGDVSRGEWKGRKGTFLIDRDKKALLEGKRAKLSSTCP